MTQEAIQRQIEAIRRVSSELAKSPEAAWQSLINAGILKESDRTESKTDKKKK